MPEITRNGKEGLQQMMDFALTQITKAHQEGDKQMYEYWFNRWAEYRYKVNNW